MFKVSTEMSLVDGQLLDGHFKGGLDICKWLSVTNLTTVKQNNVDKIDKNCII